MRIVTKLYSNWLFHKGDIEVSRPVEKGLTYMQAKTERKKVGPAAYHYTDAPSVWTFNGEVHNERWEEISLPHDFIIDQNADENENNSLGYFKYFNGWYRRHFRLDADAADKRITLEFDGVATRSEIYLNGCLVGRNFSAYNSFEVDITDYVYFDKENVLAVYVNTDDFEGWWYQGGGIYRDVRLVVSDRLAVDRYGVYAPVAKTSDTKWRVDIETAVRNDYDEPRSFDITHYLRFNNEIVASVSTAGSADMRSKTHATVFLTVENPKLWSVDNPNLYTVKTVISSNGVDLDSSETRIGFRTVRMDAESGLYINDEPVKIKGVCCHQDFGLTGIAVPDNILRYKIEQIKSMGANGFRTAHYQHASATLDACDELGLLVMDEARWFDSTPEGVMQLSELVKRDRNRPSVIMWSTSNEEPSHIDDNGRRKHKSLYAAIRKLDKTRPITCAEDAKPRESAVFPHCDIIGINYNLDSFDDVHRQYPDKPMVSSECCATGTTRDWFLGENAAGRICDRDIDSNLWYRSRESTWKFIADRPYIMGGYQWAAVEHRGEAAWPTLCSKSGAFDLFMRKKGAYYQNKSLWSNDPVAHIVTHWNYQGLEGSEIPVTVYTNCDEAELFLNGASLGRRSVQPYTPLDWSVPYEQGSLTVKGYNNGMPAAEHTRVTTGKPDKLSLTCELNAAADGQSLVLFTCTCLDKTGNTVPNAANTVRFSVAAPAVIVGTGSDNCDHVSVCSHERKMYMGVITVAVRPAAGQKSLTLYAESDFCGLAKYECKLS